MSASELRSRCGILYMYPVVIFDQPHLGIMLVGQRTIPN